MCSECIFSYSSEGYMNVLRSYQQNMHIFFCIEDIQLCLIIYRLNKLFIVAVKHNNSIFNC